MKSRRYLIPFAANSSNLTKEEGPETSSSRFRKSNSPLGLPDVNAHALEGFPNLVIHN
jgi:hypothetical protein